MKNKILAAANALVIGTLVWPIVALILVLFSDAAAKEFNEVGFYGIGLIMIPLSWFLSVKSIYDEEMDSLEGEEHDV